MGNSFLFLRWQELQAGRDGKEGDRENSAELLKDFSASVFT